MSRHTPVPAASETASSGHPPADHVCRVDIVRGANWGLWGLAILLGLLAWWPLVLGHGLVGGDIYTYFFPLKAWYADRLQLGELALWNPLIGNGMPALGESQTGVLYPANLILYALLPLNAAYNASFLLHYILAFAFTGLYARRLGVGLAGMVLTGVVFVYGWFPARSCLEWAIVTGAWLPVALWATDGFLVEGRARYWLCVVAAPAVQLLAGHFNLAFITLLVLSIYVPLRCLTLAASPGERFRRAAAVALALGLALGIAAVQLLPSLELKGRSQRSSSVFRSQELGYGKIPASYLAQILIPWAYYPGVRDGAMREWIEKAYSNQVEAHLYFGMAPLLLAAAAQFGRGRAAVLRIWLVLGAFGLLMVTGWWTELLGRLPGFGYFKGPGRYGVIVQLAVAISSGFALDRLLQQYRSWYLPAAISAGILSVTWLDLRWATQCVEYAHAVAEPPIMNRARSPVAQRLLLTDRVLSVNQNSVSLCGAAMLPVYLGIGPAEYTVPPTKLPDSFRWDGPLSDELLDWLRHAGVTHILALDPHPAWPCELVWAGYDPMLHRLLARNPQQPLWLYRLKGALGRAYWFPAEPDVRAAGAEGDGEVERVISDVTVTSNRVQLAVDLPVRATVVLSDLAYPGWRVSVDGALVESATHRQMYRSVTVGPGQHTVRWEYRPPYVGWGIVLSGLSGLLALGIGLQLGRSVPGNHAL